MPDDQPKGQVSPPLSAEQVKKLSRWQLERLVHLRQQLRGEPRMPSFDDVTDDELRTLVQRLGAPGE